METIQIRIEASRLPGRACGQGSLQYGNVHVGVQRRGRPEEFLGLFPGDAPSAEWRLECRAAQTPQGFDITGPYVQGRPGGRFVYLSWVNLDGDGAPAMFRRAKLMADALDPAVVEAATRSGVLLARLGLTDAEGRPLCAAVRPPAITWSAGSGEPG